MVNTQGGRKKLNEILGEKSDKIVSNLETMSEDLAKYVIEIAYGEFYTRPGMSDKHREVAAVACLIGQGNIGKPFKSHIEGMLNVGHSRNDVIELLLFLIPYIGFPTIIEAMRSAHELFRAIDARQ